MKNYFDIEIAGLKRSLPICKISETKGIAAFVGFSDIELNVECAKEFIKLAPEFDVIVTAESKGITFAYEMSRQSGKPYVLLRKAKKLYMKEPIEFEVKSLTTQKLQHFYLDSIDAQFLKGKKVIILDDVISTGNSLYAMEKILNQTHCNVVAKMCALTEGEAKDRDDLISLGHLPIIDL